MTLRPISRIALLSTATMAMAVALGFRAGLGPFETPLGRLQSPVGLATVLFYAVAAAVLFRLRGSGSSPDQHASVLAPRAVLAFALLACLWLFLSAGAGAFLSDDYILVLRAASEGNSLHDVWFAGGGDGAYRPVGAHYFHIASWYAGFTPLEWRKLSLLLHVSNAALLWLLCRKLWPHLRGLACTAAALFLVHGTRPEVVYWTAGSFDLLACFFSLLAVIWWLCRPLQSTPLQWAGAAGFLVLAILSKESAYAVPLVGVLLMLASARPSGVRPRSFAVLSFGVAAALAVHRFLLFGGPGGYADTASGRPQILSLSAVSTAKALMARIWELLFLPINWEAGESWLVAAGIVVCVACQVFVRGGARPLPGRGLLLLAIAVLISVLPAVHLALIGENLLGSRILYLPSVAFCILTAACMPMRGRLAGLFLAAVVASHTLFLAHNLSAWRAASELADAVCSEPPHSSDAPDLPSQRNGAYVFSNGYAECRMMKTETGALP